MINIKNGTPNFSNKPLCNTCRNATIIEGDKDTRKLVFCNAGNADSIKINWPVFKCSSYEDKSKPSKWDMERIAWKLEFDKEKRFIGFRPPKEREDYL